MYQNLGDLGQSSLGKKKMVAKKIYHFELLHQAIFAFSFIFPGRVFLLPGTSLRPKSSYLHLPSD
jgi:hypothetical protein